MRSRPTNSVLCWRFDKQTFCEELIRAAGSPTNDRIGRQVEYLAKYVEDLGARTFVVEKHYIDRHFIEEFGLYYARCLAVPPNACARIHLFAEEFDDAALDAKLVRAGRNEGEKKEVQDSLSMRYIGFVVVRPLPEVPIGRTILKAPENDPGSEILVTTTNDVHLLGLQLQLTGLAFQQQDRAVGACATATLWMALSKAARLDGARTPTPAFIAEAASRNSVAEGRGLPSRGLTIEQAAAAVRACGFAPEMFRVSGPGASKPEEFAAAVYCYLRSGIPVVLVLDGEGAAHSVTAVGYKLGNPRGGLDYLYPIKSASIEHLYVHDDRIGPYAVAQMWATPAGEVTEKNKEEPLPGLLFFEVDKDEGPLMVRLALVPVYPKLRISAADLLKASNKFVAYVSDAVATIPGADAKLTSEIFFQKAGDYLSELVSTRTTYDLPEEQLVRFLRAVALSRWVGVIRWTLEGSRVADFLLDTTDTLREEERAHDLLIGLVAYQPAVRRHLRALAKKIGAQFV